MKIVMDDGAYMPVRAHEDDAGLDLRTCETKIIWPGMSEVFDTGIHIGIPRGYYGKIESKSGLNVNYGIVSCGGVIDAGYTGSIKVKLYNLGKESHKFYAGDKIAQLVFMPCLIPDSIEVVDSLGSTERGDNGFGSSGV